MFDRASSLYVNNINDQLDAAITILLIFESAQHVSGNLLPIFEKHPSHRTHNLRRRTPDLQPTTALDNTPYCCNHSLTLLKMDKRYPKHVELIERSIKLLLLHLVCHLYYSVSKVLHASKVFTGAGV